MTFPTTDFLSNEVNYTVSLSVQNGLSTFQLDIGINFPTNEGSLLTQDLMDRISIGIANVCNQRIPNIIGTVVKRTYTGTRVAILPYP